MLRNTNMYSENPLLSINVRMWQFLSVLSSSNWQVYIFVLPVCVLNVMQFCYLYDMWGNWTVFILNIFFAAAIFNALLRTCLVIINRVEFEKFMMKLTQMYNEIQEFGDSESRAILGVATRAARTISIFNLTASFCDVLGALLYPPITGSRVHPFGVALPGVNMTATPYYEIAYALQLPTPIVLTVMYMPFVSLFASFALFGSATLKILQRKLRAVCDGGGANGTYSYWKLRMCITDYGRIEKYVRDLNNLVTYIVFVEFVLFNAIICSLLFCLNIINRASQIISVIMYISTMLYVLFTYYWQANELYVESLKIAEAAFEMQWYHGDRILKRTLMLFIARTQKPLKITVGNIYPMNLGTFQALLNASYSYFTMLRGVYNKSI